MKILKKSCAAMILVLASSANAGLILDWEGTGVDFYSSWLDANTLRIEIDAANPMAGWASAVNIDSIAINSPGSWSWSSSSDITLSGPGTFGGPVDGTGLNAGGCQSISLGGNHQCWSGLATLTDNMYFDFTFSGSAVISSQTDNPHLKVRFVDANGGKVGSLLSQDLRSVKVSEPATLGMLALGLAGLIYTRRRN